MYRLLCLTFPVCSQCCASRNQLPRDKLHPVLEKHSPPLNWGMSVLAISFNGKQTVKLLFFYVYMALPPLSRFCSNKRQQQTKNHGDHGGHWSCTQLQVPDSAPLCCKAKKKNICLCSRFWSQLFKRVNLTPTSHHWLRHLKSPFFPLQTLQNTSNLRKKTVSWSSFTLQGELRLVSVQHGNQRWISDDQ